MSVDADRVSHPSRIIPLSPESEPRSDKPAYWILVLFATSFVRFDVIGQLYLIELALLMFVAARALRHQGIGLPHELRRLVVVASLWLYSQVLADLANGSSFHDYSRGWSKIIFFVFDLLGTWVILARDPRRISLAVLGLALGSVVGYFLQPSAYAYDDPWKFGFALPVTLAAAVFATSAWSTRGRFRPTAIFLSLSLTHFSLNFRSLGGICLMTALYLLFCVRRQTNPSKWSAPRTVGFLLVAAVGVTVALNMYTSLAAQGSLGLPAQQKYELQGTGRYGPLLGGRPEIFFSINAIAQSPLIGHGSFTRLRNADTVRVATELRDFGYIRLSGVLLDEDVVPTHSHLFGAWVEAGLAGALFWIGTAALACRSLILSLRQSHPHVALHAFLGISFLWDVFFSPFGADRRIAIPVILLAFLTSIAMCQPRERSAR